MNEFLQLSGATSIGVFCLIGVCAMIGCFIAALSSAGSSPDEWEESEDSELERSITVEEFCTVIPPTDVILNETPAAMPQLVRRATKKTTLKTSQVSRPQGET